MVDYTTFLRLTKPPFDEIPWDDAVNGNMDIIDAFVSLYMYVPNFTGAWTTATSYVVGQNALDTSVNLIYTCAITHTSGTSTFSADRVAHPTYWTQTIPAAPVSPIGRTDAGRNHIDNSTFGVAQRGPGPFTTTGEHTLDRWCVWFNAGVAQVQQIAASDADRLAIGDESAYFYLRCDLDGTAGAGDLVKVCQYIENVRRLADKTVTVSFWAKLSTGSVPMSLGVNMHQDFGSGGSTGVVVRPIGFSFPLTASFVRYSAVFEIPSIIGMSLGSNYDSWTALNFFGSSGATYNDPAGQIGVQAGCGFDLWGVQVEEGSTVTDLEVGSASASLAACQRFYQIYPSITVNGYTPAPNNFFTNIVFNNPMQQTPTATLNISGSVGVATPTAVSAVDFSSAQLRTGIGAGYGIENVSLSLSCEFIEP